MSNNCKSVKEACGSHAKREKITRSCKEASFLTLTTVFCALLTGWADPKSHHKALLLKNDCIPVLAAKGKEM